MALAPSSRLGPYEILAPLGAGGMGEVYRARDPRLGREVALKVLRADALGDGERRRRFEIEARAASSLNHPNILTIYDIGEEGGTPYFVSELVEGESLRVALRDGSLPTRKLLDIAVQIADGLAAAHQVGITHRDLKPENIMLTREGRAKILDFGLARPAAAPDEATVSELVTKPGVVLGTLAYMSPEQARGEKVDFRSDQFSFGSMLYEMATGERPFQRQDLIETLSAIAKEDAVPVANLSPQTPAPLRWVIDRCLAKEASQRYASTADLHQQLRDLRDHLAEVVSSEGVVPPVVAQPSRRKRAFPALLVLLGAAIGLVLAAGLMPPPEPGISSYRFTPFATEATDETQPAWSLDGQNLAYVARANGVMQVFTRNVSSSVPAQITKAPADCAFPLWSPDGTRLYYVSQGNLWSVAAAGGPPQLVPKDSGREPGQRESPTISPDGRTLAFFQHDGERASLWFYSTQTGDSTRYNSAPFPGQFRFGRALQFSPDGSQVIVCLVERVAVDAGSQIWLVPYPSGSPRLVAAKLPRQAFLRRFSWMPDGRRVAFSTELMSGHGNHLYLLDTKTGDVRTLTGGIDQEREPSVSPDGQSIAFVASRSDWDLVEGVLDRPGASALLATSRSEYFPMWSPSGRQLAYVSDARGAPEIWLRSLSDSWAKPLVGRGAEGVPDPNGAPRFSSDGQRIAFVLVGDRHLVWIMHVAGGPPIPLEHESNDQHSPAWSPDGNWIAYTRLVGGGFEIAKAPLGGGSKPVTLLNARSAFAGTIDWSPSGDWIGYIHEAGLGLVSPDGKIQRVLRTSAVTGFEFSKDGSKVYVIRPAAGQRWELAVIGIRSGEEKKLTDLNLPAYSQIRGFSIHPDGKRFATSVGTSKSDIWILEGFERQASWLGWLRAGRWRDAR